MESYLEGAGYNLATLRQNPYPGRGLIVGMDKTGKFLVQVYWIMGRSENSRNRVFKSDKDGRLWTAPADPSKVKDPSLIIYNAMAQNIDLFVVSNGHQTDHIITADNKCENLYDALSAWKYEPDTPNFTPRISAIHCLSKHPFIEISILKRSPWGEGCDKYLYHYEQLPPGLGWCVTTYKGDGDPLPAFEGDPYLLPIAGSIDYLLTFYWATLNPDNRVSIAVKFIDLKTGESTIRIMNKYTEVANVQA